MLLGCKKIVSIVFSVAFSALLGFGQKTDSFVIGLNGQAKKTVIEVLGSDISINYSIDSIKLNFLENAEGSFFRVSIPDHIYTASPGKPELPVLNKMVVVPNGYKYKIKISEVKTEVVRLSDHNISSLLYPAQEGATKNPQEVVQAFKIDNFVYGNDSFFCIDTVSIEAVGTSRGNNLATLSISPIRYNPKANSMEIITSMKIDVTFETDEFTTEASGTESLVYRQMITDLTLNYNENEVIPRFSEEPIKMVILTDSSFVNSLKPYITWKNQKGFKTIMLAIGEKLEDYTYTQIRDTLKKVYDLHKSLGAPPDYLLIVGNVSIIPYYAGATYITDLYYGEMDGGSDYIPEMLIGRLPAKDTLDVKNITSKIIQYEKNDFGEENDFASKSLMFAGVDATYYRIMNGQIRYGVENYLLPENNISEHHFYYPTVNKDSVISLINSGLSFINYTGHGSTTALLNVNFNTSDTSKLINSGRYPLLIANACQTSNFTVNSLGNTMVTAKNKGMIGYIGSSQDTYWDEDFYWAVGLGNPGDNPTYATTGLGALDRLFHTHGEEPSEWYTSLGEIVFAGNMAVSSSTSSKKKRYWEIYNVVGDPSLVPILGTPDSILVSVPDSLPNAVATLSFKGEPFCYAAVSKHDTLLMASHIGPNGLISFDLQGISNDSVVLVITGQNKIPFIKTIYISDIHGEYVTLSSHTFNDDSGNDNGLAEYSENINIDLSLDNLGASGTDSLYVKISTASEWVEMVSDSVFIGFMAGHTSVGLTDKFSFRVADSIPDFYSVSFDVMVKDSINEKHFEINIVLHAPKLYITSSYLDDTETGNGNYIPDSGETFQLVFNIRNNGSISALSTLSITANNPDLNIGEIAPFTLAPYTTVAITATITQMEVLPIGTDLYFQAIVSCGSYTAQSEVFIRVGGITESFESGNLDYFPWFNLSPSPWTITTITPYSGRFAAISGGISHNQKSRLFINTYYPKKDTITFYYKVASEKNYDFLYFILNGVTKLKVSGVIDWTEAQFEVPAGYNTMEWVYVKDKSVSYSEDRAIIDFIEFSKIEKIGFIEKDIELISVAPPIREEALALEELTVKLYNLGTDTIMGFNLAYRVNNGTPITQFFGDTIYSYGDTVTVTFEQKIDFSGDELYEIEAYNIDEDNYRYNDTVKMDYVAKDLEVTGFISPTLDGIRGVEEVTVGLYNLGVDTVSGFNLGYSINGGTTVEQYFNETVYPFGDTIKVTFGIGADFSSIGSYELKVFSMDGDFSSINDTVWITIVNLGFDLEMAKIVAPVQKESVGRETVSVKLLNNGPEKLGSFTLGYMVDGNTPYYETFDQLFLPGSDSVLVSFIQKANLSVFGEYEITVFGHSTNDINRLNDTLRVTIKNEDPASIIDNPSVIDSIKIFPNPFVGHFNLTFVSKSEGKIRLTLFDMSGKKIKVIETVATYGENSVAIEADQLPEGFYLLRIEINGDTYTERIIKI